MRNFHLAKETPVVILNYPRSGSNFLNYLIRNLYDKELWKNHGQTREFWEPPRHWHSGSLLPGPHHYPFSLIFVLRNYKECITSLTSPNWAASPAYAKNAPLIPMMKQDEYPHATPLAGSGGCHLTYYLRLLKHYDELEKDKMLVYYEDFILDPVATLEEVVKFLKNFDWFVSEEIKQLFYDNIEMHRKISYGTPGRNRSSDGKTLIYHSYKISAVHRINTDNYIKKYYSHLWEKYLKRYEEVTDV